MADLNVAIRISAQDQASGPLGAVQRALGGLTGAAKSPLGAIGSLVGGLGAIGLAANGLSAIGGAFTGLAADATEAQKVSAQTNAVLESTHGVSGMTADAVADLAASFSKVIPIEDETIQSAENMLLTFTNIGKDVFPQATETALDMATALGTDSTQSAMMLGKALNDPIQGVTALRRVGVQLTDSQEELVKKMVASGDVMGAQKVILGELQTEFGGSAVAAGKTFGGQLTILQTQLGNLKEAAFTPLLGVVGQFAVGLTDFVSNDTFVAWVTDLANTLSGVLTQAFSFAADAFTALQAIFTAFTGDAGAIGVVYDIIRKVFGDSVAEFVQPFLQAFMDAIPQIQAFADLVVQRFQILGQIVGQVFSGDFAGAFATFRGQLTDNTSQITTILGQWAQQFLGWIAPLVPPLLQQLGGLLRDITVWMLGTGLPMLVNQLGEWAGAFLDWIGPMVPPMLRALGTMLAQLVGWLIDEGLPALANQLEEWGQAFIAWIGPRIPGILAALGELLAELGSWLIGTAAPAIATHLEQWGTAFVEWIGPKIPEVLSALEGLLLEIGNWIIQTAVPVIVTSLVTWGMAFIDWVAKDAIPGIPGALEGIASAVSGWVAGGGAAAMAAEGAKLGVALVQGVTQGILNSIGSVISAGTALGRAAADAARQAVDAHSPSRVMILLGEDIGDGLQLGIVQAIPKVKQAVKTMGDSILDEMGAYVDSIEGLLETTGDKLSDIASKAAQASQDAVTQSLSAIQDAASSAGMSITSAVQGLADQRTSRSQQDSISAVEDADRSAHARMRDEEERRYELARDLGRAKTADERKAIQDRFNDATVDLLHRRQIEEEERAFGMQEDRKVRAMQDALADQALTKQLARLIEEKDARVTAIEGALAAKQAKIAADADKERQTLLKSLQQRAQDLQQQLVDKIPALTGAAEATLNVFMDRVAARVAEMVGQITRSMAGAVTSIGTPLSITAPNPQPAPGGGRTTGPQFAEGGLVPGPIGMPILATVHGGEYVIPNRGARGGGDGMIDYDALAAAMSRVQLSVSVTDMQAGLLRLQRRNVSTGIA